jgi:hypothetical protein
LLIVDSNLVLVAVSSIGGKGRGHGGHDSDNQDG